MGRSRANCSKLLDVGVKLLVPYHWHLFQAVTAFLQPTQKACFLPHRRKSCRLRDVYILFRISAKECRLYVQLLQLKVFCHYDSKYEPDDRHFNYWRQYIVIVDVMFLFEPFRDDLSFIFGLF